MRLILLIPLITILSLDLHAQGEEVNTVGFTFLDYNFKLPDNFLSSKSIVVVTVPHKAGNTKERGDWKSFAELAHKQFRRMGIDAIGYYNSDDLMSGRDATITFSKSFKKRKVKNIIFLSQVSAVTNGVSSDQFVIVITPFNGDASLMTHGQQAWKTQSIELNRVFKILGNEVYKSEQAKTNFLITDLPELFNDTKMIYGRRFGVNCRDLKVDKLGIPKFKKIEIPEQKPDRPFNNLLEKEIAIYNAQVDVDNKKLAEIMKTYPFEYGLLEGESDDDFYREGFQYVLLSLNTSGVSMRQLLNYKMDYTETDYITIRATEYGSTLKSIPVNALVSKFYVRHLYTKDVYTGGKWDADQSWEDALRNFIRNIKDEFKID
jgi:hypothetical protein